MTSERDPTRRSAGATEVGKVAPRWRELSLARESALTLLARGLSFILSLAASIVIARGLGPSLKGAYNLVVLILGAVSLFLLFGLGSAAVYYGAKDPALLPELTGNALAAGLLLGLAGLAVADLLTLHQAFRVYLEANNITPSLLREAAFTIPIIQMQAYFQEIIRAAGKIVAYNVASIAQALAGLVAALVFVVILGWQLEGAVLAWMTASLVSFLVAAWLALRASGSRLKVNVRVFIQSLKYGIRLHPGNLAQFLNYRLSVFIIGAYLTSQEIGWYVTGTALVERLWEIPHAIRTVLLYQVAAREETDDSHVTTARVNRMMLGLLGVVCVLMAAISYPLVKLMYGDAFLSAVPIIRILLPGVWALSAGKLLAAHLAATGRPGVGTVGALASLVATTVLNLLLIPRYGIRGSATATSIAYGLSSVIIVASFLRTSKLSFWDALVVQPRDIKALWARFVRIARGQATPTNRGS